MGAVDYIMRCCRNMCWVVVEEDARRPTSSRVLVQVENLEAGQESPPWTLFSCEEHVQF